MSITSILQRVTKAQREGRLLSAVSSRLKPFLYGIKHTINNPAAAKRITLHCPDYVNPSNDSNEVNIVKRIFQSYKRMKEDQKTVSDLFLPSALWQAHLDSSGSSYSYLTDGLKYNDMEKFHYFLSNFGTWKVYHGIESQTLIRDNMNSLIRRNYLKNIVFLNQLNLWNVFSANKKPISCLSYPTYGNQAGAYIDGEFVGVGSFFNEIYGSMLADIISDIKRPTVADLGAGYGKLAFFTLRNVDNFCFIDFDLPETLCLAAYFLMNTWPNKKTLLYGEQEYSQGQHKKYDLIFMPSWEIVKPGENSIDLFINKNSLGEMSKNAAINYVDNIARSTKYFFHENHEVYRNTYSNDSSGLLGYEYPVPKDKFKLLFKYPDIGHILYQGGVEGIDIFLYLYERRLGAKAGFQPADRTG